MKDLWRLPYEEQRAITHRLPAVGSKWRRGGTAKTDVGRARRATAFEIAEVYRDERALLHGDGMSFWVSLANLNTEWEQVTEAP